jgi:preprotein translocase subunit SecG
MSARKRTSYDPIGFWGRLKRASLTLGVPILLAAILPVAFALVAAMPKEVWILLPVAVALIDLRTVIRRNQEGKSSSGGGRLGGILGGGKTQKTTITKSLLILVVLFVALPMMVAQQFLHSASKQSRTA